jgi:polyhydroxyalkanoate synthesis regulator phasin
VGGLNRCKEKVEISIHYASFEAFLHACREKQEYASLEGEIDRLTGRKQKLENRLATAGGDYVLVAEISEQLAEVIDEIDKKTDRWLELAEVAELASA